MDTLTKLTRLIEGADSKKDTDKTAAVKKIVTFLVSGTSWSEVASELCSLSRNEVTAVKFGLTDEEFTDLKKKSNKGKESDFVLSIFKKAIHKKLEQILIEVEKNTNADGFEDVILPLLVLSAGFPLKYLPENDPFGARVNYYTTDNFNKEKTYLYAPKSYKTLSLNNSSSDLILRPLIIPILQFVIKSDRYITSKRLKDVPFLVQSLRFAVHFEDPQMEILRSSFWQLAIKVIKAVDLMKNTESKAIFDQLNCLTWYDNGEECTKAIWRINVSSPMKSLVMAREEMYAYIALLRGLNRRISLNVHLKSCLRDVIKAMMKSISYRKCPEDCMVLLKMLNSWISKGKDGPLELHFVRMMVRDVMDAYDSFLAKCPSESQGETTKFLLTLGQESLAIYSNLKSIKSSLESICDRINNTISKSGQDGKKCISEYMAFLIDFIDDCGDSSIDVSETPWCILFRAVAVRCFVVKMKVEWVESTDVFHPLYKKMSHLLKIASDGLKENSSCDYMNECIPILTEIVYLTIHSNMNIEKKWKCVVNLSDSHIPSEIIRLISIMKNQSAKSQCSAFILKMMDPLTGMVNSHPPKLTLSIFESFFTVALTVDLPTQIRESVCILWKKWYESRMNELEGASISDELLGRLKWFNLPIPSKFINTKFELKINEAGSSPIKNSSTLEKSVLSLSPPRIIKKTTNAKDALKMIDLMDEDSIQFFAVAESPKKKQRMTEKQKEMMMEKKDRLPFMEDESTTGIPKIPADIFEMSVSGVEGSKSIGAKKGPLKIDFSDMTVNKKSAENESKWTKKEKKMEATEMEKKKKTLDDNMEESVSSSESVNEEMEEESKRGGRRKSKTPMKMTVKTREVRSPSRKKLEASIPIDSPINKRKSKRLGKVDEKNVVEKMEEKQKEEEVREDKEDSTNEMDDVDMSEMPSDMEVSTSRRSYKITLSSSINNGKEKVEENEDEDGDDTPLPVLEDTPLSSQSLDDNSSPTKSLNEDLPIPSTPANRGPFEPIGILSSSKKSKSEKKRGGVHFNISEEEKIVEVEDEEGERKEEEKKEEEEMGKEEKNDKMVFPLLRHNEDSIDTISLKLGHNSRTVKMSLEKMGVKTVGQLAALSAKEINGVMGIKPPKMRTVESVLEGVYTRSEKSASKPLPPICTPEKKKETTVFSPKKLEDVPSSKEITQSISTTPPPKSKSRKRLALSNSPIAVKKSKVEEEKEENEETKEKEKEKIEEKKEEIDIVEEEKKIEAIDKSDEVEKKEEKCEEVMTIDEDENKENGEKEKEMEKPVIASVQDVLSYIKHLKGGSMESLLAAHEQITLSFLEAIRDVRNSQSSK